MNKVHYQFLPGDESEPVLLLLHGTGGDETSLMPIAKELAPNATILSIRGPLVENGMTRYFRHTPDGGFDLADLAVQLDWLKTTIVELAESHRLDPAKFVVVGYSNGANVAAEMLLHDPHFFQAAALFHAMELQPAENIIQIPDKSVWLSHGTKDPIVSDTNFASLTASFEKSGAQMTTFVAEQSHHITPDELQSAKDWFAKELVEK